MKKLDIRRRMALWYTITIVALMTLFFGILYSSLSPTIAHYVQDRIIRDSASVADGVQPDTDGGIQMTDVVISTDTLYTVYLLDGAPAYTNHRQRWFIDEPFDDGATREISAGGQEWILHDGAVIGTNGEPIAYVRTGAPLGANSDAAGALLIILLVVLPIGALAAIFIGMGIAKKSLEPIDEMTRTAQEISAGDFSRRVDRHDTNDEVGRLERAFNQMLDSLESSMEREKQFTSDASHELRTPLAVIIGASQTSLETENATPDDYAAALRIIYSKATDMQAMLSQMLLLARGPAQSKVMELTDLNFSDIVLDIAEEFEDAAAKKQIEIRSEIEPDVHVTGDLMLVTRAVMNLLDNGIKYGRKGGWLDIRLTREDGSAVLAISDNGIGIRPEHLPHIFDRFYRGDPSRSTSGFGLGLSLVERIASLHGGSVSADSSFGEGSCFSLVLPLA